jgi:hypothetical protein
MDLLEPYGVCIPQSYTSHAAPLSSHKLWTEVAKFGNDPKHFDTPYVVQFHNVNILAEPKEVWKFVHDPNKKKNCEWGSLGYNQHNERYQTLSFEIQQDTVLVILS